ncbi:MAG: NACHT domain-containing protein [Methanobrevibacter sp.]|nr:NACHT domain-containing protein [Methanobrevibacter sp.]
MKLFEKTFVIFISSTFEDFKIERSLLQNNVFPKIKKLCNENGFDFLPLDLQWGVSEEAHLNQQTMEIILNLIQYFSNISRTFYMITLLGDKTGWIPLPNMIEKKEFEQLLLANVHEKDKKLLIKWYQCDLNSIPPVYNLMPRTGKYIDFDNWYEIESSLKRILQKSSLKLYNRDEIEKNRLKKYFTSAVEQEISVFYEGSDKENIICFFRSIDSRNLKINAKTIEEYIRFFNLNSSINIDLNEKNLNSYLDSTKQHSLYNLKEVLSLITPDNIWEYRGKIKESSEKYGTNKMNEIHVEFDINEFCNQTYLYLSNRIKKQMNSFYEMSSIEREIKTTNKFVAEKARLFHGRIDILLAIEKYILNNNSAEPLVILGEPGSGKTALFSKAIENAKKRFPDSNIISRFVGESFDFINLSDLILSIIQEISLMYGFIYNDIPDTLEELINDFHDVLNRVSSESLIIFIDGLNLLENANHLAWLPLKLCENLKIILSLNTDTFNKFLEKISKKYILKLRPFNKAEGEVILRKWLTDTYKALTYWQYEEILNKFQSNGLPMFLKLAFDESLKWKSYTPKHETQIPATISDMVTFLIEKLISKHGTLITAILGYITSSKYGLSQTSLMNLLSNDKEVVNELNKLDPNSPSFDAIPYIHWILCYIDIENYLKRVVFCDVQLLSFNTTYFSEIFQKMYLDKEANHFHSLLIDYFGNSLPNSTTFELQELAYQLSKSHSFKKLYEVLSDLDLFIKLYNHDKFSVNEYWSKIEQNTHFDIEDTYEKYIENSDLNPENLEILNNFLQSAGYLKLSKKTVNSYLEDTILLYPWK